MTTVRHTDAPIGGSVTEQGDVWDENELRRGRRQRFLRVQGCRLALLVVVLGGWQLATARWVDPFWISRPSDIGQRLAEWLGDGTIAKHALATIQAMLLGFVTGATVGVLVAFVLGRSAFLATVLDPFIIAVYSLPKVALAPLFILWFGIGLTSRVLLAGIIVFFLVFYNTFAGVRAVDRDLVDVVRLMGGGRRDILRRVVLPSSASWIFTGLKVSVPYALIGAVVGELTASDRGLGYILKQASGEFDTAGVFAALAILTVIATVLNQLDIFSERHVSRWADTADR